MVSEDEEVCEKSLKEESKAEQVAKEGWNFVINFAKKIRLKQQSKIF